LKGREETLIGSEDRLAGAVEQVRRDLFRVARLPNSSRTYVATNATWKDKESGEIQDADRVAPRCSVGQIRRMGQLLKKGPLVEVEGELGYREF
jgi:hypothetical protein